MNVLIVGSEKAPISTHIPNDNFLLIDDGSIIDLVADLGLTTRTFDVAVHSFDPLKDIDYRRAQDFIHVLDAAFPEGENTLTKRGSNYLLRKALLHKPQRLSRLLSDSKDPYQKDAYQKIQTLLMSPVLKRVLDNGTNFSLSGTILAKLDRAELGDFDCFVLANLLISQFEGTVVIPDFGFYASPFHVGLFRQKRLIVGINSFEELPEWRHKLLQFDTKVPSRCTPDDAAILGVYEGYVRGTVGHTNFVQQAIA